MGKYKVSATSFRVKQAKSTSFKLNNAYRDSATLELSSDGIYLLDVKGIGDTYTIENRVRRTPEYKTAINKVTSAMLAEFDEENNHYVQMTKRSLKMIVRKQLEDERSKLKMDHYERASLAIKKPTEGDVQTLLKNEGLSAYHKSLTRESEVEDFIKKNTKSVLDERICMWAEIQKLHDDIEKANEEKNNRLFAQTYNAKIKAFDDILNGAPSAIEDAFGNIKDSLIVPYNVEIDYSYYQDAKTIDIDVEIPSSIDVYIPQEKATILASGKISIKKKLQKEIKADATNSQLSLMYYVASFAFSVTPHIDKCRISLYSEKKKYGLCWIEFQKNTFKNSPNDISDFLVSYPIICNLSEYHGSQVLQAIETNNFKYLIAGKIQ